MVYQCASGQQIRLRVLIDASPLLEEDSAPDHPIAPHGSCEHM